MTRLVIGHDLFLFIAEETIFFSNPATTRSMASSKSSISTASLSFRACRAASFTTFARSPDESRRALGDGTQIHPGTQTHVLGVKPQNGFSSVQVEPIDEDLAVEPTRSQEGESRISGRFVAAGMITPRRESKPSISTNSWLSVCSVRHARPVGWPRVLCRARPVRR